MQAEFSNNRGNGFIITPASPDFLSENSPKKQLQLSENTSSAAKNISLAADACISYTKFSAKAFLTKALSATVAVCCLLSLFHIYTFGTGVYIGNTSLGALQSNADFSSAVTMAKDIAGNAGISIPDDAVTTSVCFTLQKSILSPEEMKDKILLSTGSFTEGCNLYCDGTLVFTAKDKKSAVSAVNKYISSFSMNGDAEISATTTYKNSVVAKATVSDVENCVRLLSENSNISVISVVNSTTSEKIPYETKTENDSNLYIGETVTVTEGREGNMRISRETVYENGNEKSNRIVSQQVTTTPVIEVVRIGTKPKNVLKTGLLYPLKGTLSSSFGERWGRMHEGMDIAVPEGTPVKAAECGTVSYVNENSNGYGKIVRIDHGYGIETAYAHLSEIQVYEGQTVPAGATIALSGNTGRSTGPHLHFEIIENGNPIDPAQYLRN